MRNLLKIILLFYLIINNVICIALAPSTVGDVIAGAGHLSYTIKETEAWKKLTSQPNNFVRILPARAMEVVQEVVGNFRQQQKGRIVIKLPNGALRGKSQNYKNGAKGFYYSFRGIRYGQPPVGEQRFLAASPEGPWRGVRSALREGNTCPHRNMILNTYKGNEDCLFLNVYTPELPNIKNHPKLPVMVWIHGGGFTFGSGNAFLYGPDFLVAEQVVLVTFNYRLGPLGFLCYGNEIPGNAGLKDQVLALKWVQENIAAFGGDPDKVTIFGESAGSASVHYLILSKMANGLYNQAISQSGTALNPWALSLNPKERVQNLASQLGLNTNNTRLIIDYLRKIPARVLIDTASKTLTYEDVKKNIGLPFVPCIEEFNITNNVDNNIDELLIVEHPLELLKKGKFNKVPYIVGYNSHEAMLFVRRVKKDPNLLPSMDNDFGRLLPNDLNIPGGHESPEADAISREIRGYYLNSQPVSEQTIDEMIDLLTDTMFVRGIVNAVRYHSVYSNSSYLYRFGFDGSLGLYKRMLGISRPGTCHGDELGYLFYFGVFNLNIDSQTIEMLVKRRMVKMWTNFAKFSNPTPNDDAELNAVWQPVNFNMTKDTNYLDITSNLESRTNPDKGRLKFWDGLYERYNGNIL